MRAFWAIELPEEVRAEMARAADDLAQACRRFRVPREGNLHLTLAFLGEIDEARVAPLTAAVGRALLSAEPFSLRFGGAGRFPEQRFPEQSPARVAWIGAIEGKPEVVTLARRVVDACAEAGCSADSRPLHPHVTVGRVKVGRLKDGRGSGGFAGLEEWQRARLSLPCGPSFRVEQVTLFRSELGPGGSTYIPLATGKLALVPGLGGR